MEVFYKGRAGALIPAAVLKDNGNDVDVMILVDRYDRHAGEQFTARRKDLQQLIYDSKGFTKYAPY